MQRTWSVQNEMQFFLEWNSSSKRKESFRGCEKSKEKYLLKRFRACLKLYFFETEEHFEEWKKWGLNSIKPWSVKNIARELELKVSLDKFWLFFILICSTAAFRNLKLPPYHKNSYPSQKYGKLWSIYV